MAKSKLQQYVLIGVGVMVAIGFSGVFTYGNMVNSSGNQNQDGQQIQAELPSQNYKEGSFNLSVRQQAYLALNEQVVFVNAFYTNDSQQYSGIDSLTSEFSNRVYINVLNGSESTVGSNLDLDMPSALIVGNQPTQRRPYTLRGAEPDTASIKEGICGAMRDVSEFGATCYAG
jgi:hypothetical protein